MPVKTIRFAWDIPITSLLGLIASGEADMKVDVFGDNRPVPLSKLLAGGVAGLLPPPKSHGNSGIPRLRGRDQSGQPKTAQTAMLEAMAAAPDHTLALSAMRPIVGALGLAPGSANSQISVIVKKHAWATQLHPGTYRLTAAGVAECQRRGFAAAAPPEPVKPKPKKPVRIPKAPKANGVAHHG